MPVSCLAVIGIYFVLVDRGPDGMNDIQRPPKNLQTQQNGKGVRLICVLQAG